MFQKLTNEERNRALLEMQSIALSRGGKCLSVQYTNNRTHLQWECSHGHQWNAAPDNIKHRKSWCPYCVGKGRLTVKILQKDAAKHGGQLISKNYLGHDKHHLWQCSNGHRWKTSAHSIRNGHWCPVCAGKAIGTIEEMHNIAKSHNGKCLSTTYKNGSTKLTWECSDGHVWNANSNSIKRGRWCKTCAGLDHLTIEEMHSIAKSRGGRCLSNQYVNNHTKLIWQCKKGHIWEARPHEIKDAEQWCAICSEYGSSSKAERKIRKILRVLTGEPFEKRRPNTLINPKTGRPLEIDCLSIELHFGIEVDGIQHYKFHGKFHTTIEDLKYQQYKDRVTDNWAEENNITLIRIRPFELKKSELQNHIIQILKENNIPLLVEV